MPDIGARSKYYEDVIAFPTTKSSGAVTYVSAEMYPFESGAYGPAMIHLHADAKVKIGTAGDTIEVNAYVSFDNGDSWLKVATYKDLAYAGSGSVDVQYWIPLAPRLKIDAVFAAGDSLLAGHGCAINVEFKELHPGKQRELYYDDYATSSIGFVGDTRATGDSSDAAEGSWKNSDPIEAEHFFDSVFVWAHANDRSKVVPAGGDTMKISLQFSNDGTTYWHGDSLMVALPSYAASGIFMGAEEINSGTVSYLNMVNGLNTKQGKYARLCVYGDTDFALTGGHGMKFFMLGFKR